MKLPDSTKVNTTVTIISTGIGLIPILKELVATQADMSRFSMTLAGGLLTGTFLLLAILFFLRERIGKTNRIQEQSSNVYLSKTNFIFQIDGTAIFLGLAIVLLGVVVTASIVSYDPHEPTETPLGVVWESPNIQFYHQSKTIQNRKPLYNGDKVFSEDKVTIQATANYDSNITVILHDSSGKANRLFVYSSDGNKQTQKQIRAGETVFLPSINKGWEIDQHLGLEIFYVLSSKNPIEDNKLSQLLEQMNQVDPRGVSGIVDLSFHDQEIDRAISSKVDSFFHNQKDIEITKITLRHVDLAR